MNEIFASAMRICALISASWFWSPALARLIVWRYFGVMPSTMVSPIASWKPSCAPFWNSGGCWL